MLVDSGAPESTSSSTKSETSDKKNTITISLLGIDFVYKTDKNAQKSRTNKNHANAIIMKWFKSALSIY